MGEDNSDDILLQTTPNDTSTLNDSPGLDSINIIHSADNKTFTPEREARGIFNT
jgi:hypothetical protein